MYAYFPLPYTFSTQFKKSTIQKLKEKLQNAVIMCLDGGGAHL